MSRSPSPRDEEQCPFLVPVMADRLWLHPTIAYCRRPGARRRVPSRRSTLACICSTRAHLICPGYLESTTRRATAGPT